MTSYNYTRPFLETKETLTFQRDSIPPWPAFIEPRTTGSATGIQAFGRSVLVVLSLVIDKVSYCYSRPSREIKLNASEKQKNIDESSAFGLPLEPDSTSPIDSDWIVSVWNRRSSRTLTRKLIFINLWTTWKETRAIEIQRARIASWYRVEWSRLS